jgi:hypothetical protein
MSAAEDQKQALQAVLAQALGALQGLSDEQRAVAPDGASLLERVISYAQLVVERTDPDLISTPANGALQTAVTPVIADPATTSTTAQTSADAVLVTLSAFPAAQSRDIEQVAQAALGSFEKSASERIAALHAQATKAESELAALASSITAESDRLRGEIETAGTTLQTTVQTLATTAQTSVDTLIAGVQAKVTEFDTAIAAQRQAIEESRASQTEAFSTSQGERAALFQEEFKKVREEMTDLSTSSGQEVESRVGEIRRMEEESAALVGAIGLAGTAERYGEEAKAQKKVADLMRGLTVLFAVGAVVTAGIAASHKSDQWQAITGKLAVSAVLGGLATYTGKQSGRHRVREERARNLQLELTAFAPFIEPLDKDQQDFERVIMTRRTFGQIAALPEADADHAFGPLGPVEALRNKVLPGPPAA